MLDIAATIEVPDVHVAERRVAATAGADFGPQGTIEPLIKIASSGTAPQDAFVSVSYQGKWFWIEDRDPASKKLFSFILLLFTFVETGSRDAAPVLTIPTTR